MASCACHPGASCIGRVSGFQKLSRGCRRLVALLLSFLPPGSLYPGLPQSSLPSLRHPMAFLWQQFGSTAGTAISLLSSYRGLSSPYVPLILSLSLPTPLNENPAFPYQRDCLNPWLNQNSKDLDQRWLVYWQWQLMTITPSCSHARLTIFGSRHASAGHWLTVSYQPERLV